MIQTKSPVIYGARSEKSGIIKIEVRPETPTLEGCEYLVIDWDIANLKDAYFSKKVFYTNEKIDELDSFIEANYDLSGLGKAQKERKKIQIALMLDTQTNLLSSGKTIYGLNPNDWEFTPDPIEETPTEA